MNEIRVKVDRSRMVAYRNCPRLRLLGYHWEGTGLSPSQVREPLEDGDRVHQVLEGLWKGVPFEELLERHLEGLPWERRTVLELMLRAFQAYRWPQLGADYELLLSEQEILWELGRQQVGPDTVLIVEMMIRVDGLLRDRLEGGLWYLEYKTTKAGGSDWAKTWTHNTQVLINTLALEEVLGERIEGVLIEGLVKDPRTAYGYQKGGERSLFYRPGWAKGEIHDPASWFTALSPDDYGKFCAPVPPIRPLRAQLDRKRAELLAQEVAVWHHLHLSPHEREVAFPHHDEHCFRYYRHACEFEPLCFTAQIERDPLGSGLYQRRTPHHALEHADVQLGQGLEVRVPRPGLGAAGWETECGGADPGRCPGGSPSAGR